MKGLIQKHQHGPDMGIRSVRRADPLVMEAALRLNSRSDGKVLLADQPTR